MHLTHKLDALRRAEEKARMQIARAIEAVSERAGQAEARSLGEEAVHTLQTLSIEKKLEDLSARVAEASAADLKEARAELARLRGEVEGVKRLKAASPETVKGLDRKIYRLWDAVSAKMHEHELEEKRDRVILHRLLDRASQLEESAQTGEAKAEALAFFRSKALARQVRGIRKEITRAHRPRQLFEQSRRLERVEDELRGMQRELRASEVFETFTRAAEKEEALREIGELKASVDSVRAALEARASELSEAVDSLTRKEGELESSLRDAKPSPELMAALEELRSRISAAPPAAELQSLSLRLDSLGRLLGEVQAAVRRDEELSARQLESLSREVAVIQSRVRSISEASASREAELVRKAAALEKAMDDARRLPAEDMAKAAALIRAEVTGLEKGMERLRSGEEELKGEVGRIARSVEMLDTRTREELRARLDREREAILRQVVEVEKRGATAEELVALHSRLEALEKELGADEAAFRVAGARRALGLDIEEVRKRLESLELGAKLVPKPEAAAALAQGVAGPAREEMGRVQKELFALGGDFDEYARQARELGQKLEACEASGVCTPDVAREFSKFEQELRDVDEHRKGVTAAVDAAKAGRLGDAKALLEKEKAFLDDLRLDVNWARRRLGELPRAVAGKALAAAERRAAAEEGVSHFEELKKTLEEMRKARELLKREIEAATPGETAVLRPEKALASLAAIESLAPPAGESRVSSLLEALNAELREKELKSLPAAELAVVRQKMAAAVARLKQLEAAGGPALPTLAALRTRLETSLAELSKAEGLEGVAASAADAAKELALVEEIAALAPGEAVGLADLASRVGLSVDEARRLLARIEGGFAFEGQRVTRK
jgi:chromosome segregation ATPase